ncbi:hypothetical protein GW17_00019647 [Ensete ventricosum]|nr:hypothetical protein GW17_00019647 [Ensete ventricosum]
MQREAQASFQRIYRDAYLGRLGLVGSLLGRRGLKHVALENVVTLPDELESLLTYGRGDVVTGLHSLQVPSQSGVLRGRYPECDDPETLVARPSDRVPSELAAIISPIVPETCLSAIWPTDEQYPLAVGDRRRVRAGAVVDRRTVPPGRWRQAACQGWRNGRPVYDIPDDRQSMTCQVL